MFLRASGEGAPLDGVVIVRGAEPPEDDEGRTEAFDAGLIEGIAESDAAAVAVERSDAAESAIPFFAPFGVTTVDSVDLTSGRIAWSSRCSEPREASGSRGRRTACVPELLERPSRNEQAP